MICLAGPQTALIKSTGKVVIAGRLFFWPILQRVDKLSLRLRTLTVKTENSATLNGVGVTVASCCQVKIQGWLPAAHDRPGADGDVFGVDEASIRLAAQHFVGKSEAEIDGAILHTIVGHQRAIIGSLTVEQLYRDRALFTQRVVELCQNEMRTMGIAIVSYTVAEISDDSGYITALGVTQVERVKRDAKEGLALHRNAATATRLEQEALAYTLANDQENRKIDSDKVRDLAASNAQREINDCLAVQAKANKIECAEQNQVLYVARQNAAAAAERAERDVMAERVKQEVLVKEIRVNARADAELYREKAAAEEGKVRAVAEAECDRLAAVAEAEAKGAMEAAHTDVLRARVQMWNECGNEGAILEAMIKKLPEIAAAVTAPVENTERMVFTSS